MAPLIVRHRVNQISECARLAAQYGAEIDLRSQGSQIILTHDAFTSGDAWEPYLKAYGPGHEAPLILNTKEDGLEERLIRDCDQAGVSRLFFLDLPIPTQIRLGRNGFRKTAVRVSEYEPLELARALRGMAEWAWVDCFSGRVPEAEFLRSLQELEYRVCLVSPELQKYDESVVRKHAQAGKLLRPGLDAVCTKFPELWS